MSEQPASDGHPATEQIAAFLDGRLAGEERERLSIHLADCEDCYELFSETARYLREEERKSGSSADAADGSDGMESVLRPDRGRWRRGVWISGSIAAAATLGAVLLWTPAGDLLGPRSASPSVTDLTASLPSAEALAPFVSASWTRHGWPVKRGAGLVLGHEEERAFQIGVRVVEMNVALSAGEAELAVELTEDLERLLEEVELADPLIILYAGEAGLRGQLESGGSPAELLELNRHGDQLLGPDEATDNAGFVNGTWYSLGKWAGAAHLAAAAGDVEFFSDRDRLRELRQLAREVLPLEVQSALERLTALTTDQPDQHLAQIEEELRNLIAVAGGGEPSRAAR